MIIARPLARPRSKCSSVTLSVIGFPDFIFESDNRLIRLERKSFRLEKTSTIRITFRRSASAYSVNREIKPNGLECIANSSVLDLYDNVVTPNLGCKATA